MSNKLAIAFDDVRVVVDRPPNWMVDRMPPGTKHRGSSDADADYVATIEDILEPLSGRERLDAARLIAMATFGSHFGDYTAASKHLSDRGLENMARWFSAFPKVAYLRHRATMTCGIPHVRIRSTSESEIDFLCVLVRDASFFCRRASMTSIEREVPDILSGCNGRIRDFLDSLPRTENAYIPGDMSDPVMALSSSFAVSPSTASCALYARKSLRSRYDLCDPWHKHPTPTTDKRLVWPKCLPDKPAGKGMLGVGVDVDIRVLESSENLVLETVEMGHCVGRGGYDQACMDGYTRIISVRIGDERSTAEIRIERIDDRGMSTTSPIPFVQQIRGPRNAEVSQRMKDAVRAYAKGAQMAIRMLMGISNWKGRELPGELDLDTLAAAWSPFLPRPLRGLPGADMAATLVKWRSMSTVGRLMRIGWRHERDRLTTAKGAASRPSLFFVYAAETVIFS